MMTPQGPAFPPDINVPDPTYCSRPSQSKGMPSPCSCSYTMGTNYFCVFDKSVVPYNQADCPYPLKYNRDEEANFAKSNYDFEKMCVYPCPDPMWTESEWIGDHTVHP